MVQRTKSVWSVSSTLVGEVQNLTATLQPNHDSESETFVVLQWDAPSKDTEDKITAYDIRFRPDGEDAYCEESVDGCNRMILLTKSSGLSHWQRTAWKWELELRLLKENGKQCHNTLVRWLNAYIPTYLHTVIKQIKPKIQFSARNSILRIYGQI